MSWQTDNIPALNLIAKYDILHKIVLFNWMPSGYSTTVRKDLVDLMYRIGHSILVDLGSRIFNKIFSFVEHRKEAKVNLPFPILIYGVILHEGFKNMSLKI